MSSDDKAGLAAPFQTSDELVSKFKAGMRKLAATVSLVTTSEEGTWHGMPATAVCSLSMEPPSLLVCINRSASMHGPTSRQRHFCINLLSAHQAKLMRDFSAQPSGERFDIGSWQEGLHRLPYLEEAAAVLFCVVMDELHYGTHTVFIGRIEGALADDTAEPLVYQSGVVGRFVTS